MHRPTILVTGATGLLGPYLMEAARKSGKGIGVARSHADLNLDITDRWAVAESLREIKPDVVVHAAALCDVDLCQSDPERAFLLNRDAVGFLVDSLPASTKLVYISTDQVYPDRPGLHKEGSEAPINVYGASKLEGERLALQHPRALALRTNLFGPSRTEGRASLSDFVVDSLSKGKTITLFTDIYFSPLHMTTLSELLMQAAFADLTGAYNMGCRHGVSKKDFALAVARHKGLKTDTAIIGESSVIPDRAPRPKDMRMDISSFEQAMGMRLPPLEKEIELL